MPVSAANPMPWPPLDGVLERPPRDVECPVGTRVWLTHREASAAAICVAVDGPWHRYNLL